MVSVRKDNRHIEHGSIVCENSVLRLRVTRPDSSLRLVIEARDLHDNWLPLASSPPEWHPDYLDADGLAQQMQFYSYDPLLADGATYGITMHGFLGEARITLTSTISEASTWTQHRLEIYDIPQMPCRQLAQCWQLAPAFLSADIAWPAKVLQQSQLVETPAAFQQVGPFFVALVPDIEEGDAALLGLRSTLQEHASLAYGVIDSGQMVLIPPHGMRLAYTLCVDARALPLQGFQEIVRLHGSQEALALASGTLTAPLPGELPPLPALPDAIDWIPFMYEGSPGAIAAWVQYLLSLAEQGDDHLLEDALCWLDRLCFHQRVCELPGSDTLGSIGSGAAWQLARLWTPMLLLHAFRLTGMLEYAYRAKAALSALPPADQARMLHQLAPIFGDIYVHAEYQLALALGPVAIHAVTCKPQDIAVAFTRTQPHTPLRLVVTGAADFCTITVNAALLGVIPATQLSRGIELP